MSKRIISYILIGILMIQGFAMSAYAQETGSLTTEKEELKYQGYLLKFADGVEAPPESSGIKHLAGEIYIVDTQEQVYALYEENEIDFIEPNYEMEFFSTPNDTYYSEQRDYLDNINAQSFWDMDVDGEGTVIAVIDSGLSTGHEDINYDNIIPGKNYFTDSSNTEDYLGHGTKVTGILSAVKDNGKGVAGLLSKVKIAPLKVANNSNSIVLSAVVSAIHGAVDDYEAQVINLSVGFKSSATSEALKTAVEYAEGKNVIMVAAVGNNGTSDLLYPAGYEGVIGVGAVDANNIVRASSQKNDSVFVTAPGENIYSSTYGNKYEYSSGTSYSAPFVAAMAAAAKSKNPDMTIDEFKELLKDSSVDAGEEGYDTSYGHGIIDIRAFLQEVLGDSYEDSVIVVKCQNAKGTSLSKDATIRINSDKSYSITAPEISGYSALGYKIEGAKTKSLNTTYALKENSTTGIAYADIEDGVTSVTYIYKQKSVGEGSENPIEFNFAGNYGGKANDAFHDIALTNDGGFVAVGYSIGVSENPAWGNLPSSSGAASNDGIVVKFDADNNVQWAKSYGTAGTDLLHSVAQIKDGTIVAVGQAPHVFTEGGNSTVSGYVLKINPEDPTDYEEIFLGGTKGDYLHAVVATEDGGYAIAGRSASADSETWKDVRVTTNTTQDGVIAKFSAEGTLVFSACYNSTGKLSRFYDMAVDNEGNLIVVGDHQIAKNLYNSQIVKYNGQTGEVMWGKSAGTTKTAPVNTAAEGHTSSYVGVTVLADGSYVATGLAKSASNTGENWGLIGKMDGIIVHYKPDGEVLSGTNIGTINGEMNMEGVAAANDGGYVVFGSADHGILEDREYGWTIAGGQDAIVLKYDAEDDLQWSESYGYTGNDYFYDMVYTELGEVIAVGEANSVGGTLNLRNNGKFDAIIYTNKGVSATSEIVVKCETANGSSIINQASVRVNPDKDYTIAAPEISGYIAAIYKIEGAANSEANGTFDLKNGESAKIAFSNIDSGVTVITYIYEGVDTDSKALFYSDGTYQDSAHGFGGLVTVKVTVNSSAVSAIEVVSHSESIYQGTDYMAKASKLIPEMIKNQTSEVDAISGATMSSNGLKGAVANCLLHAEAATVVKYINAIGETITLESEANIKKAKNTYYMLDTYARTYVTNYEKLTKAEETLSALKKGLTGEDKTAPTLTAGSVSRTSDTTATIKFTSSEVGHYYYAIVVDGDTAPIIDTSGDGNAFTSSETTITNPTGLTAGNKDIYIKVKDVAGNVSNALKINIAAYTATSGSSSSGGSSKSSGSSSSSSTTKGTTDYKVSATVSKGVAKAEVKISNIKESKNLQIQSSVANIVFDENALKTILSEAKTDLAAKINVLEKTSFSQEIQKIVGDRPVYDITLTSGEKTISNFGSGTVSVEFPYTLKQGEEPEGIIVYHMDDEGKLTQMKTIYNSKEKTVTFKTNHFSKYIVGYDESLVGKSTDQISFTDIAENAWYAKAVQYAYKNNIMKGISDTKFEPNASATRAMVCTIFWNMEKQPAVTGVIKFTDVAANSWYSNPVIWATEKAIANGVGESSFAPENKVTREQFAQFLYGYAKYKGDNVATTKDLSAYDDKPSAWAEEAVEWAVEKNIINGKGDGRLDPQGTATRAEIAQMIMKFNEEI